MLPVCAKAICGGIATTPRAQANASSPIEKVRAIPDTFIAITLYAFQLLVLIRVTL
jgi:hypothetical protein